MRGGWLVERDGISRFTQIQQYIHHVGKTNLGPYKSVILLPSSGQILELHQHIVKQ